MTADYLAAGQPDLYDNFRKFWLDFVETAQPMANDRTWPEQWDYLYNLASEVLESMAAAQPKAYERVYWARRNGAFRGLGAERNMYNLLALLDFLPAERHRLELEAARDLHDNDPDVIEARERQAEIAKREAEEKAKRDAEQKVELERQAAQRERDQEAAEQRAQEAREAYRAKWAGVSSKSEQDRVAAWFAARQKVAAKAQFDEDITEPSFNWSEDSQRSGQLRRWAREVTGQPLGVSNSLLGAALAAWKKRVDAAEAEFWHVIAEFIPEPEKPAPTLAKAYGQAPKAAPTVDRMPRLKAVIEAGEYKSQRAVASAAEDANGTAENYRNALRQAERENLVRKNENGVYEWAA